MQVFGQFFFQKKMIYSFSNNFPNLEQKQKNYLHISKKNSTFAVKIYAYA